MTPDDLTNKLLRSPDSRTFLVLGDAGDGRDDDNDTYAYREPHVTIMETTGPWTGARFNVPARQAASWKPVT
jgi:hypothetical protein